jgi:pimeloyl-ACP methyl ester carboxylesterase
MKGLIVAVAALVMGPAAMAGAQTTAPPLSAEATKSFADFENFGPHRAFVVGPDGKAAWWAGVGGPDPGSAVASAMRRCEERNKQGCVLYAVNNYTVTGGEWRQMVPARAADAPDIGRLRPAPYWSMRGPQRATGLIVWSHGYMAGKNSTENPPQPWVGRFTHLGYDLYRFDREWINDWPGDATSLADAVAKARQLGYRRILLAGQSAGAWVSLAALQRGAPVDGVISISAAHHGEVTKMRDTTRALRLAAHGRDAETRAEGRAGELRRRCLRRRRPHGRCTLGLRQERHRRCDRRRSEWLQGPRRRRRLLLRPQVRALHPGFYRKGQQAAALLEQIPKCWKRS